MKNLTYSRKTVKTGVNPHPKLPLRRTLITQTRIT